jgi:hypothetical protein
MPDSDNELIDFDSLPFEVRKEIIEKIEALGEHYDRLISLSKIKEIITNFNQQ